LPRAQSLQGEPYGAGLQAEGFANDVEGENGTTSTRHPELGFIPSLRFLSQITLDGFLENRQHQCLGSGVDNRASFTATDPNEGGKYLRMLDRRIGVEDRRRHSGPSRQADCR
jgi:hypothetical protein